MGGAQVNAQSHLAQNAADSLKNLKSAPTLTRRIWDQLRRGSNVSLKDVHLGGSGKALSFLPDAVRRRRIGRGEPAGKRRTCSSRPAA